MMKKVVVNIIKSGKIDLKKDGDNLFPIYEIQFNQLSKKIHHKRKNMILYTKSKLM